MGLRFTIADDTLCLIYDAQSNWALGTGFTFLKPDWVVTAKHVVIAEGRIRE